MLKVFKRLTEMNLEALMEVYQEGNMERGQEFFPNDSPEAQKIRAEAAFEDYLREDFFRVPRAFYGVWEENETYCCALRMEPYQDGWLLEALETKPACRKQGYAIKLVDAVLKQLPKGSCVYSHVGKRNTASLTTHRRCGFVKALDYAKYVDGTVTQKACTMKIVL